MAHTSEFKENDGAAEEMIFDLPRLEQILIGRGVSVEEAKTRISELSARFGGVIPASVWRQWVNDYFSEAALIGIVMEIGQAWSKVNATGKGPVGKASAELSG